MPFDAANYADNEVSAAGVEVGKLRRLSEALKGEMPVGFRWQFEEVFVERTVHPSFLRAWLLKEQPHCETAGCALGLAHVIGLFPNARYLEGEKVQEGFYSLFGLSKEETGEVFGVYGYDVDDPRLVMPWMVAAAIDRIIARETA